MICNLVLKNISTLIIEVIPHDIKLIGYQLLKIGFLISFTVFLLSLALIKQTKTLPYRCTEVLNLPQGKILNILLMSL
jgi:hypothetical protein